MRLVVTGGGTGGHVFPALEIAKAARDRGARIFTNLAVRGIELRLLGPPQECVRADPYRAGRCLHVSVREQRGNRLLLLVVEFCAVS